MPPTSNAASAAFSTSSTIEHFVLFKLSSSLGALSSLPAFYHLSAGPILRLRSTGASELTFTHLLHNQYSLSLSIYIYIISSTYWLQFASFLFASILAPTCLVFCSNSSMPVTGTH
ncbi:hypothetical protein FCM35_KLT03414 [Carex littledalei]|uniref:Uncharacterized protein n=1 Tax=Carex littledalei TaxID=544730 RepID=A0A833VRC1_9POAL|nr:hypothetical protein FCM35_KLT03414 [Carex littledalei]